ncbi:MAG: response regulator [Bacteroidota bacterium]
MEQSGKVKVLVVDDSDIIRHALKTFFEDYNFDVITCLDGLEGVQKASEFKPDIIFLDLMMPNFDGMRMLQVIKVLDNIKKIPVIVISANTDKKNVLAAIEAGAARVLSKPLQKDVIIKFVNELLGSEVLSKSQKKKTISDSEKSEMQKTLLKFFLGSFPEKKKKLQLGLETKNKELVRTLAHEIRGNGGTIGYSELSALSGEIEDKILSGDFDWSFIESKCKVLCQKVAEIENINLVQTKG